MHVHALAWCNLWALAWHQNGGKFEDGERLNDHFTARGIMLGRVGGVVLGRVGESLVGEVVLRWFEGAHPGRVSPACHSIAQYMCAD